MRNCHYSLGFQWLKYTNALIYIKEIWHELWYFNDNFAHFDTKTWWKHYFFAQWDDCGSTTVTDNLLVHSSLPPAMKTHLSYQVKLQKEVKSTQKQQSYKKRCCPCKKDSMKKLWNQRWWPRSGCDGRIMTKFLIATIQMSLVPISSETWRRQHKLLLLKILH